MKLLGHSLPSRRCFSRGRTRRGRRVILDLGSRQGGRYYRSDPVARDGARALHACTWSSRRWWHIPACNWNSLRKPSKSWGCIYACLSKQPITFIVETVEPVDRWTLVVSSEQEEILREFDFISQQQTDGFDGLLSAINVVSQEQVIRIWGEPTILKYLQ